MKLNCKAGDLAVIVCRNEVQHLGKIVQCISLWDEDSWICEPDLKGFDGAPLAWADESLRPIRDNDGEDETFSMGTSTNKGDSMDDLTDEQLDALLSGGLFALTIGLALVGAIFFLNLG